MKQIINLIALMFSGFVAGYCVGLNPTPAEPVTASETFVARVSAYCACEKCCQGSADGITASGHQIKSGDKLVAADRRYTFGTMLQIPGYGIVPVLDRGGAIKGNKLDVYFDSHQKALEWGVRNLQVKIER